MKHTQQNTKHHASQQSINNTSVRVSLFEMHVFTNKESNIVFKLVLPSAVVFAELKYFCSYQENIWTYKNYLVH